MNELRKGSLFFTKELLVDFIYIVHSRNEIEVTARKLDAPSSQMEKISLSKCVRLADEQERLLPQDVMLAIEEQRKVVFTSSKRVKKKGSLEKTLKRIPKEAIEDILRTLAEAGIKEGEEEGR